MKRQRIVSLAWVAVLAGCTAAADAPGLSDGGGDNATTAELVINEVSVRDGDWVELYVVGDVAVDLGRYTLVDDNPDHQPQSLPPSTLEPGDFFVIEATGAATDGTTLGFKLGSSDGLTLARDGVVIDRLEWTGADVPDGATFGRFGDGAAETTALSPTPGAGNARFDATAAGDTVFEADRVIPVELELRPEDWAAILAAPLDETYYSGDIVFDGERLSEVAIRVKGNSSLMSVAGSDSHRFSFKVDTNRYVAGQTLRDVKKLNFNNGFKDPSLIREHLAYEVAREVGLPAPRTAFVELTVAGEHLGLYTMVEQVDDEFLARHFQDAGGDLYKPEGQSGRLRDRGSTIADYPDITPKTNEDTTDHAAFLSFVATLNAGGELPLVLDVDNALRYLAFNTLLSNLDSYYGMGHNYYLYEQQGVFSVIPWDLNEAFGNFTCGCNAQGMLDLLIDAPTCGAVVDYPLLHQLLSVEAYAATYHDLLAQWLDGVFAPAGMQARIDRAADLIRPYVAADTTKFHTTADFETNLAEDVTRGMTAIGLMRFVTERGAAVASQLAGQMASSDGGAGSCSRGGPGPGPGPGPGHPCGDGVCDQAEQNDPNLCPQDC